MAASDNLYRTLSEILKDEPAPSAFVRMEAFERNLKALESRSGGKPIRVATKSLRCVPLLKHAAANSPKLRGWMTYHARETVFLAQQGLDDFLLAYPTSDPRDADALAQLAARGTRLMLMADLPEHLDLYQAAAQKTNVQFRICLDLDLSIRYPGIHFGVRRSAVHTPGQALAVARYAQGCPNVVLDGLMGYEAQIAGLGDDALGLGWKGPIVRGLKARAVGQVAQRRRQVVDALQNLLGRRLSLVNGGGTGSLETSAAEEVVTEVTAGSGLYASGLFDRYRGFRHEPAAGYMLEVSRHPMPGVFTALGGGYTASGVPGPDKAVLPWLPEGMRLTAEEGAGEVQTPFYYTGSVPLKVGSRVFFRHAKAGELSERFNELLLLRNGAIEHRAPTYRGQGQVFM